MGRDAVTGWQRFVHYGFYLLYNQFAWSYDAVSWLVSLGDWRRWQLAVLPFVQGDSVLEIAHGTGHLLHALRRRGKRVVGLDASPYMNRIARRRTAGNSVPLLQGSALALPFCAAHFDTVVTTFPTNFILDLRSLQSIRRCMKPSGVLLIVPEGHLLGNTLLHRLIAWLFKITGQQMEAETVWDAWEAQFARAGLTFEVHQIAHPRSTSTVLLARRC